MWAKFAYTATDGKTYDVDYYNLDTSLCHSCADSNGSYLHKSGCRKGIYGTHDIYRNAADSEGSRHCQDKWRDDMCIEFNQIT